jgi:hypothetical protein
MITLAADRDRLTAQLAELERTAKVAEAHAHADALVAVQEYIGRMRALPVGDDERLQIRTRIASHLRKLILAATTDGRALRFGFDGPWGGALQKAEGHEEWVWEKEERALAAAE